jgi:hypothetical protein
MFACIARPAGAGPFPLAIMNHGVSLNPLDRSFFPLVEYQDPTLQLLQQRESAVYGEQCSRPIDQHDIAARVRISRHPLRHQVDQGRVFLGDVRDRLNGFLDGAAAFGLYRSSIGRIDIDAIAS